MSEQILAGEISLSSECLHHTSYHIKCTAEIHKKNNLFLHLIVRQKVKSAGEIYLFCACVLERINIRILSDKLTGGD